MLELGVSRVKYELIASVEERKQSSVRMTLGC